MISSHPFNILGGNFHVIYRSCCSKRNCTYFPQNYPTTPHAHTQFDKIHGFINYVAPKFLRCHLLAPYSPRLDAAAKSHQLQYTHLLWVLQPFLTVSCVICCSQQVPNNAASNFVFMPGLDGCVAIPLKQIDLMIQGLQFLLFYQTNHVHRVLVQCLTRHARQTFNTTALSPCCWCRRA